MDTFDTQIGNTYNVSRAIAEQWKYIKEHAVAGKSVKNLEVIDKVITDENFTFTFKVIYDDDTFTLTEPIEIPVVKGQDGVSVIDIEITPDTSNESGMTYKMEITLSNGNKINAGDFLVPNGIKGQDGVGIREIQYGTPTVNGEYTYTPVVIVLTDGSEQTLEISAKNGKGNYEVQDVITPPFDYNDFKNTGCYIINNPSYGDNAPADISNIQTQSGSLTVNKTDNQITQILTCYNFQEDPAVMLTFYRYGTINASGEVIFLEWVKPSSGGNKLYKHNIQVYKTVGSGGTDFYKVFFTITNNHSTPYSSISEISEDLYSKYSSSPIISNGIISKIQILANNEPIYQVYSVNADTDKNIIVSYNKYSFSGVASPVSLFTLDDKSGATIGDKVEEL